MNLERVALAAKAEGDERDFLRTLRDTLAKPDGSSTYTVEQAAALNLISDRLILLMRREYSREPQDDKA